MVVDAVGAAVGAEAEGGVGPEGVRKEPTSPLTTMSTKGEGGGGEGEGEEGEGVGWGGGEGVGER